MHSLISSRRYLSSYTSMNYLTLYLLCVLFPLLDGHLVYFYGNYLHQGKSHIRVLSERNNYQMNQNRDIIWKTLDISQLTSKCQYVVYFFVLFLVKSHYFTEGFYIIEFYIAFILIPSFISFSYQHVTLVTLVTIYIYQYFQR